MPSASFRLCPRTREWAIYSKVLQRWRMKANESGLGNQRSADRSNNNGNMAIYNAPTLHFKTTSRGGIVFHWAAGKRLQKGLFMGSKREAAQNITRGAVAWMMKVKEGTFITILDKFTQPICSHHRMLEFVIYHSPTSASSSTCTWPRSTRSRASSSASRGASPGRRTTSRGSRRTPPLPRR